MNTLKILLMILCLWFVGCTPQQKSYLVVSLISDGREYVYQQDEPITVEQFLKEAVNEVGEIGALDRVNPDKWTQIYDGIRITVVRVQETEECNEVEIPYQQQMQPFEALKPGEQRQAQSGRNGVQEICYRVRVEDGIAQAPVEISRITKVAAQDEIIWVGPTTDLEPVPIPGTLTYVSNNNAWVMIGSSTTKRLLTFTGDIDARVFSLSLDGRQLLFARHTNSDREFSNQLWLIPDTTNENVDPVQLTPQNVLYANWVPGTNNTISYSTGEPRSTAPGWQASNDLWILRIDPQTGEQINVQEVLPRGTNGGPLSWWGTQYKWSPDGSKLAWIHADSVGIVNLESNELEPALIEYPYLNPDLGDWSWRTNISWSADNSLIVATVHGPPFGNEPAENSPIFNIAVASTDRTFAADILEKVGIWSTPQFSPEIDEPGNPFPKGYLAYLKARNWEESIRGEYDLIVADRDGSNARTIFPPVGQPGIAPQEQISWSADGSKIAFIYQGNLWIVDVETGISHQLTQDGSASRPVWAR